MPPRPNEAPLHLESKSVDGSEVKSRLQKLLSTLLASLSLSGCFVFDEIQRGIDLMDEHAPIARAKEATHAEAQGSPESESMLPHYRAQLAKWWNSALEEESPARDPNDGIVRCVVHDKLSFTRESDCAIRGGRILGR